MSAEKSNSPEVPEPTRKRGRLWGIIVAVFAAITAFFSWVDVGIIKANQALDVVERATGLAKPIFGADTSGTKSNNPISAEAQNSVPVDPTLVAISGLLTVDSKGTHSMPINGREVRVRFRLENATGPSQLSTMGQTWQAEFRLDAVGVSARISFDAESIDGQFLSVGREYLRIGMGGRLMAPSLVVVPLEHLPNALRDRIDLYQHRLSGLECFQSAMLNRVPLIKTVADCWRAADAMSREVARDDGEIIVEMQRQLLRLVTRRSITDVVAGQNEIAQTLLAVGQICGAAKVYRDIPHNGDRSSEGKLLISQAEAQAFAASVHCARALRYPNERTEACLAEANFLRELLPNRAAGRADLRGHFVQAIRAWLDAIHCAGGSLDKRIAIEAVSTYGEIENVRALILSAGRQYPKLRQLKTSTLEQLVNALQKVDLALKG